MKIRVTRAQIAKGVRVDCTLCPVALALKSLGMEDVRVLNTNDEMVIEFYDPKKQRTYHGDAPMKVQEFVAAFDNGEVVKPFSFVLR